LLVNRARGQGQTLAIAQQQQLEELVEAELQATVARADTKKPRD